VVGRRLENALGYSGSVETTVLLEDPEILDAKVIQEDEAAAKGEAERHRPGLTMFTDGSRLDSGASGYAVTWQSSQHWVGVETHMGYNKEAYDAECAALSRTLEIVARRQTIPERVNYYFHRCPGCHQTYGLRRTRPRPAITIQARRHIVELRGARPDINIEIRWAQPIRGSPTTKRQASGQSLQTKNQTLGE